MRDQLNIHFTSLMFSSLSLCRSWNHRMYYLCLWVSSQNLFLLCPQLPLLWDLRQMLFFMILSLILFLAVCSHPSSVLPTSSNWYCPCFSNFRACEVACHSCMATMPSLLDSIWFSASIKTHTPGLRRGNLVGHVSMSGICHQFGSDVFTFLVGRCDVFTFLVGREEKFHKCIFLKPGETLSR